MAGFLRAASLAVCAIALASPGFAQTGQPAKPVQTAPMANPPRTTGGRPDLQGVWTNQSVTSLARDPKVKELVLSPKEAAALESQYVWNVATENQRGRTDDSKPGTTLGSTGGGVNAFWIDAGRHYATVKGEIRSSWIVDPPDGRLPTKKAATEARARGSYGSFDGPESRTTSERCLVGGGQSAGPIMRNTLYNNNFEFVQTPAYLMIEAEMVHDVRIIPIVKDKSEVKHRPSAITPWYGDSVGWYEGDTLVIETTGVNPKQQALMSPTGKLTERLTRWSDDEILYEFEVDDPALYTRTWKGEMTFRKSGEPLYEYACHEGNYALKDILLGARTQEAEGKVVAKNADEE